MGVFGLIRSLCIVVVYSQFFCPSTGIPRATTFQTETDVLNWVNGYGLCVSGFNNEFYSSKHIMQSVATSASESCQDGACSKVTDCTSQKEMFIFAHYVNDQKISYQITAFDATSFSISGTEHVIIQQDVLSTSYVIGTVVDSTFAQSFTFNADGTLKKREAHTQNGIAKTIIDNALPSVDSSFVCDDEILSGDGLFVPQMEGNLGEIYRAHHMDKNAIIFTQSELLLFAVLIAVFMCLTMVCLLLSTKQFCGYGSKKKYLPYEGVDRASE
eukprot:301689_1